MVFIYYRHFKNSMEGPKKCAALCRNNEPCLNNSQGSDNYCWLHGKRRNERLERNLIDNITEVLATEYGKKLFKEMKKTYSGKKLLKEIEATGPNDWWKNLKKID